ncbi:MAG: response regulator [Syntrophus sp. (in: bacteria)]|nr:response regulator [Syntrophus sp. (in: bacteria)]
MLKILLVRRDADSLSSLSSALGRYGEIELETASSGEEALTLLSGRTADLVVADENLGDMTGIELSRRLVNVNPMINCAVVSSLSPEEFHEATEGLGIMSQLPEHSTANDAEIVISTLKCIKGILD